MLKEPNFMVNLSNEQYQALKRYATGIINPKSPDFEDIIHDAWYQYQKYSIKSGEIRDFFKLMGFLIKRAETNKYSIKVTVNGKRKYIHKEDLIFTDNLRVYETVAVLKDNWYQNLTPVISLGAIRDIISKNTARVPRFKQQCFKMKI